MFTHPGEQLDNAIDRDIVENLSISNVIWANMSMVSQGFVLGMVIYTGEETKCQLNKGRGEYSGTQDSDGVRDIMDPRIAMLDKEVNRAIKYSLFILMILAGATSFFNGFYEGYFIYFLR